MRRQVANGGFDQDNMFQRCQITEKAAGGGLNDAGTAVGHGFDATSIGRLRRQVAGNAYQKGVNGLALSRGRQAAKPRQP